MKLWHSFLKELKLSSRSFYFYIEIFMAGIFLFLLLLVIPDNFSVKTSEFLYYDTSFVTNENIEKEILKNDEDGQIELVEFEWGNEIVQAKHYETETINYYVFDNLETTLGVAENEGAYAKIINVSDTGEINFTYYMQGYETDRLLNTFSALHNGASAELKEVIDATEVRQLHDYQVILSDRENIIPSVLTFNGSLVGMFILAAYIFLDKKEGVIKAYAVTTSPVWQYLLSKAGMVTVTSLITSMIITLPIMGAQPNYLVMLIFLLTTGFAASALGLLLSSYFDDIMQAFGVIFAFVIVMLLPNISYFIPTWNPEWIKYIPTYALLEGFKEVLLPAGDMTFVLISSASFLASGIVLFLFANVRFKKTLTI